MEYILAGMGATLIMLIVAYVGMVARVGRLYRECEHNHSMIFSLCMALEAGGFEPPTEQQMQEYLKENMGANKEKLH